MRIKKDAEIILHCGKAIGKVQTGDYWGAESQLSKALKLLNNKLESKE